MAATYTVTSEIFAEDHHADISEKSLTNERRVSKFLFKYPRYLHGQNGNAEARFDEDGDLEVCRSGEGVILIEHSASTELHLVGLQLWRGAFLLADYILSNPTEFQGKDVLEVGSGVGLTSIVAGFLAKRVICTDVDRGGILELIGRNFNRNESLIKSEVCIRELNFLDTNWPESLREKLRNVDVILAADVIYDDEITEGFVKTLAKLLEAGNSRTAYVALEKRYVFTISDLDSVAPMYEEFLRCVSRLHLDWNIQYLNLDFPRYFEYERLKQMILMKIRKSGNGCS